MKNIERLAKHIAKTGAQNMLVHTIPGTNNWIVCYKIENDQWLLQLCNPMGNVTYNLGIVSNDQHISLWEELIRMEVEKKTSQALMARDIKERVHKFTKKYESKNYQKFIKVSKEGKSKEVKNSLSSNIRHTRRRRSGKGILNTTRSKTLGARNLNK